MNLAAIEAGTWVRLKEIPGGNGVAERLANMGLSPGVELEVLSNNSKDPLILEVIHSRLVLSRGVAEQIIVEQS